MIEGSKFGITDHFCMGEFLKSKRARLEGNKCYMVLHRIMCNNFLSKYNWLGQEPMVRIIIMTHDLSTHQRDTATV